MKVTILKDLPSLVPLQKDWEGIRKVTDSHIFSSYQWITGWYRHFSELAEPRVVLVEDGDELVGIAPLALESHSVKGLRIRTLWSAGWVGGTHELQSVGLIVGGDGKEPSMKLMEGILKVSWNNLQLNGLPDAPPTSALQELLSSKYFTEEAVMIPRPEVNLEGVEEIFAIFSERSRRSVRKSLRALKENDRLQFRRITSPSEASLAMEEYIDMHKARWSSKGGSIFSDAKQAAFLVDMARMTAEIGESVVYQILIDDRIAAQALTLLDGQKSCVYRLGTNDDFLDHVPGYLLFYDLLSDLKSRGVKTVDLGTGAEDFKYRVGAKDRNLVNLHAIRGSLALARKMSNIKGLDRLAISTGFKEEPKGDQKKQLESE